MSAGEREALRLLREYGYALARNQRDGDSAATDKLNLLEPRLVELVAAALTQRPAPAAPDAGEVEKLAASWEQHAVLLYAHGRPEQAGVYETCAHEVRTLSEREGCSEERGLADEILAELHRARTKFPGDNVTMLALMEEVGELAKATFEEPRADVRKEAVQVATMAMRVVLDGDHTLDAWRANRGLDPLLPAPPVTTEVDDG